MTTISAALGRFILLFAFLGGIIPSVFAQTSSVQTGPRVKLISDRASYPVTPQLDDGRYEPITGKQRVRWALVDPFIPAHLVGGLFSSAFGTAVDHPKEYGPGWGGFADRFGMRLPGIVTSNVMEATAGALSGEDPRYFRSPDEPFASRVKNIIKQTFYARHPEGGFAPAYARYMAYTGSNFLANAWLPSSEANANDALIRTGEGFLGRMAGNAFSEFWPDVKQRLFHHTH
jgi:hypothetical protein